MIFQGQGDLRSVAEVARSRVVVRSGAISAPGPRREQAMFCDKASQDCLSFFSHFLLSILSLSGYDPSWFFRISGSAASPCPMPFFLWCRRFSFLGGVPVFLATRSRRAFTLIELLVVIAIIAI